MTTRLAAHKAPDAVIARARNVTELYRGSFYSVGKLSPESKKSWENTLYSKLREDFYRARRLDSSSVLVIGSSSGEEVEKHFKGVLLDLDKDALALARRDRPLSTPMHANALQLPFKDKSFDTVVLSLILSQILEEVDQATLSFHQGRLGSMIYNDHTEAALKIATAAYSEAVRVAKSQLFIIDTTDFIKTRYSFRRSDNGKPYAHLEQSTRYRLFHPSVLNPKEPMLEVHDPFVWVNQAPPVSRLMRMLNGTIRGRSFTVNIFEAMLTE